jgi:hypothetical protein
LTELTELRNADGINGIFESGSDLMQTCLKISFWFSVGFAFYSCMDDIVDPTRLEILAALFAFPGIFIKKRHYQAPAVLLFCVASTAAYVALKK